MPSSSAPARAMMPFTSGTRAMMRALDAHVGLGGHVDADGRMLAHGDDRRAFVHHRHEGLADVIGGEQRQSEADRHDGADDERPAQRALEQRIVEARQILRTSQGSSLLAGAQQSGALSAGTTVSDRMSAEASAKAMVSATGANRRPSSPSSESSGRKTVMMMTTPETSGAATSRVAS